MLRRVWELLLCSTRVNLYPGILGYQYHHGKGYMCRYSVDFIRTVPSYLSMLYDPDETGSRAPLRSNRITVTGAGQSSTWRSTTTERTMSPPTRPPLSRTLTTPSSKTTTVRCGARHKKVIKTCGSSRQATFQLAKKLASLLASAARITESRTLSTCTSYLCYMARSLE